MNKLYNYALNKVYYITDNIVYNISKEIDSDDCSKYISINVDASYIPKYNEITFVPEFIDVSCIDASNNFVWNKKYYLDRLISDGDKVSGNKFIPNPTHNKLNLNSSDPTNYI